jgi:hypothetical protein
MQSFIRKTSHWSIRAFKVVALTAMFGAWSYASATPKEYEWEKFGYSSNYLLSFVLPYREPFVAPSFKTPQEVCSGITNNFRTSFPASTYQDLKTCPTADAGLFDCVDLQRQCVSDTTVQSNGGFGVSPVCTNRPLAEAQPSRGAAGFAEFNYRTNKCNCTRTRANGSFRPDKTLWPDHDTIYCYEPPQLSLSPSKGKYN